MSLAINNLNQVNMLLTKAGLKPASIISLYPQAGIDYEKRTVGDIIIVPRGSTLSFSEESKTELSTLVKEFDIAYSIQQKNSPHHDQEGLKYQKEELQLLVGASEAQLRNLSNALSSLEKDNTNLHNHQWLGTALGFPQAAIDAYLNKTDSFRHDMQLRKAINKGHKLPSWLAYCSWIPEPARWEHGEEPEQSRALAQHYQRFIRTHSPRLAQRLEQETPILHQKRTPPQNTLLIPQGYVSL